MERNGKETKTVETSAHFVIFLCKDFERAPRVLFHFFSIPFHSFGAANVQRPY